MKYPAIALPGFLLISPLLLALAASPGQAKDRVRPEKDCTFTVTVDRNDGDENGRFIRVEGTMNTSDRGYMGIEMDDLGAQLGEYFGVESGEGVLVKQVHGDSPADQGGLKAGDVITAVDEKEVHDSTSLINALTGTAPAQKVTVKFLRKGKKKTTKVVLGELPESDQVFAFNLPDGHNMMKHFRGVAKSPHWRQMLLHSREEEGTERAADDLSELRTELDNLRQELDALREDLGK